MKNNTKIRLHLSKNLFESLAAEVLAEAKVNGGGAYTEVVKAPKQHKEKKASKPKEEGVEEMETKVAERNIKEVGGEEMKALQDFVQFISDNAEFLAGVGGIVGAAKWMASKIAKDPEARKALDKATGSGSSELGGLGGKSFGKEDK